MRFPSLMLSSNCCAKSRLCAAKASSGERSGGISPATCIRGDGIPLGEPLGDGRAAPIGPWDLDLRSMKLGRLAILPKLNARGIDPSLSLSLSHNFCTVVFPFRCS